MSCASSPFVPAYNGELGPPLALTVHLLMCFTLASSSGEPPFVMLSDFHWRSFSQTCCDKTLCAGMAGMLSGVVAP